MNRPPNSFSPTRIDLIQRYLNIENMIILDIGCGTGEYDNLFYLKGAKEVLACDINNKSIKYGYSKNKKILYSISDAQSIPFIDSSVDIVFINEVLEHVENDEKVILETHRVLKENGFIIIYAPNKFYPWETHLMIGTKNIRFPFLSWAPANIRKIVFQLFNNDYVKIYTYKSLSQKLNKFQIIDHFEVLPELRLLHHKKNYKRILNIIKLLSRTPIRKLGHSIFLIANKKKTMLVHA